MSPYSLTTVLMSPGGTRPPVWLASEHRGVIHKHFSVSTCPWLVPGEAVGGRGWEVGSPGGLFTATELVSFHLPRGKQLAIC